MAMIEFEDHDEEGRRALLHYLETGRPCDARTSDWLRMLVGFLIAVAVVIARFLGH